MKKILNILKIIGFAIAGFHSFIIIFTDLAALFLTFINPPFTSLMLYRQIFYGYKTQPLKFVSLSKIPKFVPKLLLSVEDYKFYRHGGIDIETIQEAMRRNERIGFNYYGGSTITQQLTRTLFLFPKKFLIRKYLEIIMAVEIDFIVPKDRILELYLNYVEWGKGIYGIEKASLTYYKKKHSICNLR